MADEGVEHDKELASDVKNENALGTGLGELHVSGDEVPILDDAQFQIVAAIDFGTTFSGYAYSFTSNKDAIYTNKSWGHTQGFLLHKTPTCVLLKSDGEFEAFGFDAVSKYNDLSEEDASSYYYFDRFKMKLFDNKVSR